MPKDDWTEYAIETQAQEKKDEAEYQEVKTRCLGLGLSELTFNRMVTDLTLNLIQCWHNRLKAAVNIEDLIREVVG